MTQDEAATLTLRIMDLIKAMIKDARVDNFHSAKAVGEAGDALEAALTAVTKTVNKVAKGRYLLGRHTGRSEIMEWIATIGERDHRWTFDPALAVSYAVLADADRVCGDLEDSVPGLVVVLHE